jgi:hypothetical protein
MQHKILIFLLLMMNISSIEVFGQDEDIVIDPIYPVFKGEYGDIFLYCKKYFKPKVDSLCTQCDLADCDNKLGVEIAIDTLGNVGKVTIISTTSGIEDCNILEEFAINFIKNTSGLWNCGYWQGKKATISIWTTLYIGIPCIKD